MNSKLTYALTEDGQTVHISEVARGLACGCVCPACGDKLIARKGDETEHHFAHSGGDDCRYGFTSSLYAAFHRFLSRQGWIMLPPYTRNRSITEGGRGDHVITKRAKVRIDSMELTRKASAGITGIAIYCKSRPMILRIKTDYTAGSNAKKTAQLKAAGLPAAEIDLSREDFIDDEAISVLMTTAPRQFYWLYNARAEETWEKLLSKCEKLRVEGQDNAIFTYGCTIPSMREESIYCYIKTSCSRCPFFFGLYGYEEDRYVCCSRRQLITEVADLELTLEERKKKYGIR